MTKERELLAEFKELDFRVRCCKNFTEKESRRMIVVVNRINKLKPPSNLFANVMEANDRRADQTRDLLYGREDHLEKIRAKKAAMVRPVQTRKQKVQARMAKLKSGYVTV